MNLNFFIVLRCCLWYAREIFRCVSSDKALFDPKADIAARKEIKAER